MTCGTGGDVVPGSMAARTSYIKLHTATGLSDLTFSTTFGTSPWGFDESLPMAMRTGFPASDVQLHYTATDCRPEGHVNLVFEIVTGFRPLLRRAAATTKYTGENIFEAAPRAAAA